MGWDVKKGSGRYVTMKEDKDAVVLTIIGEPLEEQQTYEGNKARRYLFNAVLKDDLKGKDEELHAAILPANIGLSVGLDETFENGKLAGKMWVKIVRNGAKGFIGTTYSVKKVGKLTSAEVKKVASAVLNDLEEAVEQNKSRR